MLRMPFVCSVAIAVSNDDCGVASMPIFQRPVMRLLDEKSSTSSGAGFGFGSVTVCDLCVERFFDGCGAVSVTGCGTGTGTGCGCGTGISGIGSGAGVGVGVGEDE